MCIRDRNVRILAKRAWQAHFVHNMFIRPETPEQLINFSPDFTIINASSVFNEKFKEHGMNSETFIIFHMGKRIAIIGGTEYGGEMKKGIFSVLHYLLPLKGVLSMHCSANVDEEGKNSLRAPSLNTPNKNIKTPEKTIAARVYK